MGAAKLLESVSAITATQTTELDDWGAHSKATFLVDVIAVTGDWTIDLNIRGATQILEVATLASITTVGLKQLIVDAKFVAAEDAVPEVNQIVYTEDSAGSLTANIYAFYAP